MINYLWGFLLIIGIVYGIVSNNVAIINNVLISSTTQALEIVMKLLPIMCLWLGIMNVAMKSGLLNILTKKISPFLKVLFPEIPNNHESLTLIASSIVMNMMGLGNAATPFGLKAMQSLKKLSDKENTATRSMMTFVIINTSCVTLIPTTIVALRVYYHSINPTEILGISILTTFLSCIVGILFDRIFYFLGRKKCC